ncbi:MAG: hypothetical protein SPH05_02930 [Streptococcus sp.]|uniref:hypothetical protein n=1 Tax=Streptococcus sp. TaxID=1306 RepID=UPI002A9149A2|nr:hypothetical protein [Streptococcus sp.]MDY5269031.1 hypothetical protein [Streptococcus sp.]
MDKTPQFNIEEAFCEYLAKYYRGSNNPVSSKTLEAVFHVKGSEIRRIVNSLRSKGEPICSDYDGYFYADNQHEINATIAQLTSRIQKIAKARDGLVNRTGKDD